MTFFKWTLIGLSCVMLGTNARAGFVRPDGTVDLTISFEGLKPSDIVGSCSDYGVDGWWHNLFAQASQEISLLTDCRCRLGTLAIVENSNSDIRVIDEKLATAPINDPFTAKAGQVKYPLDKTEATLGRVVHEFGHYLLGLGDQYTGYLFKKEWLGELHFHKGGFEMGKLNVTKDRVILGPTYKAKDFYNFPAAQTGGAAFDSVEKQHGCIMIGSKFAVPPIHLCTDSDNVGEKEVEKLGIPVLDKDAPFYYRSIQYYLHKCSCRTVVDNALAKHSFERREYPEKPEWILDTSAGQSVVICIDVSGSMSTGNRLAHAKASAKSALNRLDERSRVALMTFTGSSSVQYPLSDATESVKAAIRSRIDGLNASGGTRMWGALKTAGNLLIAEGAAQRTRNVLLYSDGETVDSSLSSSVETMYRLNGISCGAVGIQTSATVNACLQAFADATGGYFAVAEDPASLEQILNEMLTDVKSMAALPSKRGSIDGSSVVEEKVLVDAYADLEVEFTLLKGQADQKIELVAPSGRLYTSAELSAGEAGIKCRESDESLSVTLSEEAIEVGVWTVRILGGVSAGTYQLQVATKGLSQIYLKVDAALADYANLKPIAITAKTSGECYAISGAQVTATVQAPDGSEAVLTLYDDGDEKHGDAYANDGVYSNYCYEVYEVGAYKVRVNFICTDAETIPTQWLPGYSVSPESEPEEPYKVSAFARQAEAYVNIISVPLFINATRYTETAVGDWTADASTGALSGSLTVSNDTTSRKTLKAPFWYALTDTATVRLAQVDGYTVEGDAYVDITAKVEAALLARYGRTTMLPGESVTIEGVQIYTADRTQPELTALWALWADPPAESPLGDAYDRDFDGQIDDGEILRAVNDWTLQDMDDLSLLQRLKLWKAGGAL